MGEPDPSSGQTNESTFPSREALAAILDLSPDAFIGMDSRALIDFFNRGAEKMYGYTASEVMGEEFWLLFPESLRDAYAEVFRYFVESAESVGHTPVGTTRTARRKSGEDFPVEISATKFKLGDETLVGIHMTDVTSRQQMLSALATTRAIVDLSEDAVYVLDSDGKITLFNPAAEAMFGYASEEVLGRTFEQLVPTELREDYWQRFRAFLASGERGRRSVQGARIRMLRRNGEEFPADLGISRLEIPGQPGAVVRLRDATEALRAEEVRIRLASSEESIRLMLQMCGMVSHELRTPLSSIQGFASALLEYRNQLLDSEIQQHLQLIVEATRNLDLIIDDLTQMGRLNGGLFQLDMEAVSLPELIETNLRMLPAAEAARIHVQHREPNLSVWADAARLRQVLSNLTDNAIRYTPGDSVVEIRTRRRGSRAEITVRDRGPGVPLEEIEAIFTAFYRTAEAREKESVKGTGLGLAIARSLVEAQGGEIEASLPRGGGLAMSIRLPLADPDRT